MNTWHLSLGTRKQSCDLSRCPMWTLVSMRVPVSPVLLPSGITFTSPDTLKLPENCQSPGVWTIISDPCIEMHSPYMSSILSLTSKQSYLNTDYINCVFFSKLSGFKELTNPPESEHFFLLLLLLFTWCLSLTYKISSPPADNSFTVSWKYVKKYLGENKSHLGLFWAKCCEFR